MNLDQLPNELLEHICSFISATTIRNLFNVNTKLRVFVVMNVYRRNVQHMAMSDPKLEILLHQMKWSHNCMDYEVILNAFRKLDSKERWLKEPGIFEKCLYQFPSSHAHTMKVSACALYKDKFFLSFVGGNVQSRSCSDLHLINTLHESPLQHDPTEPAFLTTPMSLYEDKLAVSVPQEATVFLWNADTEEELAIFHVPPDISRIYQIKVNGTHLVCLGSWSLITWRYVSNPIQPFEVLEDIPDRRIPTTTNIYFEVHAMDMNDDYVVTHASQPLISAVYGTGPSTFTFLTCRRLLDGSNGRLLSPLTQPNKSAISHLEVQKLKLSSTKYNLLAIMQCSEVMSFNHTIKIMKIPSGEIVKNVMEDLSFGGEVRSPIQWVNNRLFLKYAPKIRDFDEDGNPQDVIMKFWNCETNEEVSVEHVGMNCLHDEVLVDHCQVIHLLNRRYRSETGDELIHQICAKTYDFWNN